MRPAVDRMHQRPVLRRIEVRRQDQPDLHRAPPSALDGELAHLAQRVAREQRAVERLERALAAAVAARREQRRRVQVARAVERQHAAVAPTARSRRRCRPATRSDGSAASSVSRQRPTRPRSSTQNSSAALSGRPGDCVVARSNAGASRRMRPLVAVEQRQVALVVERALGVVRMERDRAGRRANSAECASAVLVAAVSTRLRREASSTTTMSVWFIIAGSGARSAVIAISRPSGAMSKSSADGSHGGSASPVPGERVAAASGARRRTTNTCGSRPSVSQ